MVEALYALDEVAGTTHYIAQQRRFAVRHLARFRAGGRLA